MFFLSSAVALVVVSRRAAAHPYWRVISRYVLAAGLLAVAGFVAMGTLVMPDDAPLHPWAGLAQRALILLLIFPARIALSARLLTATTSAVRYQLPGADTTIESRADSVP
ncbi:MAG: hypothetical protein ACRDT4_21930 [Micromonosporaceae bacterium]